VLAFLTVPAVAGYEVGKGGGGSDPAASSALPDASGSLPTDGDLDSGSTGSTDSTGSEDTASADLTALADKVDDVVVNINSDVDGGGQAAGTGIVISADGLVVTNNHVIALTTGLTVEFAATGTTRSAKVLGYSVVDDVAVIQVQNVSNLTHADIGSSTSLDVGETILALGNAGGVGGEPSVVSGTVTALEQEITASDADGANAQTLQGLVQLAADIRSGDSGGPVVDTDGRVVGMTVAASAANGFGFPGQTGGAEGYAIPIEDAIAVAKKIISGEGGENIRVGANRAVLGVEIQPTLTNQRVPGGSSDSTSGGGLAVVGVQNGSGADDAGIREGATLLRIAGREIGSLNDITRALVTYDPGDRVEVTWRDADGDSHTAQITLGEGPPA
jgi:S1-C subfamily serine protease